MEAPRMIYIKKYGIFVREDLWASAKESERLSHPPIRNPEEVKIFERSLAEQEIEDDVPVFKQHF